jgi:nucleosome binding factor SPN SPT16 subunit
VVLTKEKIVFAVSQKKSKYTFFKQFLTNYLETLLEAMTKP